MPKPTTYLTPGRIEDVLLLMQYLAADDRGQIYDETIKKELGSEPVSTATKSWAAVAKAHPEFFRVSGDTANKAIALLAKFAFRKSDDGPPPHELLTTLIDTAIRLQERQEKSEERRASYLPLIVALLTGVFTLIATMLPRWVK